MTQLARIERHPCGPRLYLVGRRVHHGAAGAVGLAAGIATRSRYLTLASLALVVHDAHDFPWRDSDNHAATQVPSPVLRLHADTHQQPQPIPASGTIEGGTR